MPGNKTFLTILFCQIPPGFLEGLAFPAVPIYCSCHGHSLLLSMQDKTGNFPAGSTLLTSGLSRI